MVSRSGFIALILLLFPSALFCLGEYEPWGKDSDIYSKKIEMAATSTSFGEDAIIAFHHNILSKASGPRCRFTPTCSQYMLQAIQKYGALKGFLMGCDRLMRDNSETWLYKLALSEDGEPVKVDLP
jgi:uncharacterized protein